MRWHIAMLKHESKWRTALKTMVTAKIRYKHYLSIIIHRGGVSRSLAKFEKERALIQGGAANAAGVLYNGTNRQYRYCL